MADLIAKVDIASAYGTFREGTGVPDDEERIPVLAAWREAGIVVEREAPAAETAQAAAAEDTSEAAPEAATAGAPETATSQRGRNATSRRRHAPHA